MFIKLLTEQKDLTIQLAEVKFKYQLTRDSEYLAEMREIKRALSDVLWAIKELEVSVCNFGGVVN